MKRIFAFLLTLSLSLTWTATEAKSQGLAYVPGTGDTDGLVQGSGFLPPDSRFNYWQAAAGMGGFQLARSGSLIDHDNVANLISLSSGMWLPGQTSSSGMSMAQASGTGMIGGGTDPDGLTSVIPGTTADTSVTFEVTHTPAPAGEALVFYGTFSVSEFTDTIGIGGVSTVTGPGDLFAIADGFGVIATWTDIRKVPAVQMVFAPAGTAVTAEFAVLVDSGEQFTLTTANDTNLGLFTNSNAISYADSHIGGVVGSFPLTALPGLGAGGPPGPPGGGGSGGGGSCGGGSGGGGSGDPPGPPN